MLSLYIGPMFSGKSTSLLGHAKMYEKFEKRVLIIDSKINNRSYTNHAGATYPNGNITRISTELLEEVDTKCYDVICIDEAQFFPDLLTFVTSHLNKIVVVAGLISDYLGNKFGHISDIIHLADEIHHMKSKCGQCEKENRIVDACFTKRIVSTSDTVLIGGKESYVAVCKYHFAS